MLRRHDAGRRVLEIDYDTYAHGEAVLGWLNAVIELHSRDGMDWSAYGASLLRVLGHAFSLSRTDIGHVKLWISAGEHNLVGNLTRTGGLPLIRASHATVTRSAQLTLNARAEMPPEELERMVRLALSRTHPASVRTSITHLRCIQPGYPRPTHRYAQVAEAMLQG
jgi:hypothetical protein